MSESTASNGDAALDDTSNDADPDRSAVTDAALHVLDMGLDLDPNERNPYTRAFLSVAATFAELEAEIKRQNTMQGLTAAREQGKHTGRAPFGFDGGPEGYLSPNEDFDTAVVILDQLDRGYSKRSIARGAGVSRSTIGRIEARRDVYNGDDEPNAG